MKLAKKDDGKRLRVLVAMVTLLFFCTSLSMGGCTFARASPSDDGTTNETNFNMITPPSNYTPITTPFALLPSTESILIPPPSGKLLLVQDILPWGLNSNAQALINLGITYDVITSANFAAWDLSQYKAILLSSVQPQSFYDNIGAQIAKLNAYVAAGGALDVHACDLGIVSGAVWAYPLPGGVGHGYYDSFNNVITDLTHPVVLGRNNAYFAVECGLDYFTNLVSGTKTIMVDALARPVMIEYNYGGGTVFATTQATEYFYVNYAKPELLNQEISYVFNVLGKLPTGLPLSAKGTSALASVPSPSVAQPDQNANLMAGLMVMGAAAFVLTAVVRDGRRRR